MALTVKQKLSVKCLKRIKIFLGDPHALEVFVKSQYVLEHIYWCLMLAWTNARYQCMWIWMWFILENWNKLKGFQKTSLYFKERMFNIYKYEIIHKIVLNATNVWIQLN